VRGGQDTDGIDLNWGDERYHEVDVDAIATIETCLVKHIGTGQLFRADSDVIIDRHGRPPARIRLNATESQALAWLLKQDGPVPLGDLLQWLTPPEINRFVSVTVRARLLAVQYRYLEPEQVV
jgi:hypothetical protein